MTTVSSLEFTEDAGRARKAADDGPVSITDRGEPAHVLLSIEDYRRLLGGPVTIVDLLAMTGAEDIEFEAPSARGFFRPEDRF